MTIFNRKRIGFGLGVIGVVLGLVLSIYFSVDVFLHPAAPYVSYSSDTFLAWGYLGVFVFVGLLLSLGKIRWSAVLACFVGGVIVLAALKTTYIGVSLLLLAWFLGVSWVVGDFFIGMIIPAQRLSSGERAVLAFPLGWGALAAITLGLGLIGLYQKWIYYVLFVIITLGGFWKYWLHFRSALARKRSRTSLFLRSNSWLGNLAISLLVIVAAGSFLWSLAPAVRYDSVSYHLAVPARYIQAGRMVELPESVQTYYAHYGEMLYTIALLLGDQPLPSLINFSAGVLLTIQVYFLGIKIKNRATGIIATLIFASLPIVGIEAATTYIDIFIAVFITAAIYAALIWIEDSNSRWLLLIGIFSGLAIGVKITAFLLLMPLMGILLVKLYLDCGISTAFFSAVSALILPTVLLTCPWLIRDWIWTGNPIFPNYNSIFKSTEWFTQSFFSIKADPETSKYFLAFPWLGMADSHSYYHESPGAVLGALPWLSLPWLYGWYPRRRERKWLYGIIFLGCFAATGLLFTVAHHARYLLPLYGLISVLAAMNIETLGRMLFSWRKAAGAALVALGLIYVFSTRLAFTVRWWEIPERYPFQVWLGQEQPQAFVERVLPVHGAFEFLDQRGSPKVFSVGNELRYYTNAEIHGVFFSKRAYQALHQADTAEQLAANLAREKYDYLLIYPPEQNHRPEIYLAPALNKEFFEKYTRLEYAHRQVYVYRFLP
ncbi:MAG: glycosyltransferase family 39 protein [Chloroflexota bacterium]|nr:glycosyltransferase family 39 protein [Chloroflexota bacterium]